MAHYGSDFTSGRYTRLDRGEWGTGYDSGYRGQGWGGHSGGRGSGWSNLGRADGWGTANRGYDRDLDESWESMGHGGGRQDFGDQGYGRPGFGRSSHGRYGSSFDRSGSRFGSSPGYSDYGAGQGNFYDRDVRRFGGRIGHDYDADFSDRLRRGWNRFRNEAREWMGRGYDRGW